MVAASFMLGPTTPLLLVCVAFPGIDVSCVGCGKSPACDLVAGLLWTDPACEKIFRRLESSEPGPIVGQWHRDQHLVGGHDFKSKSEQQLPCFACKSSVSQSARRLNADRVEDSCTLCACCCCSRAQLHTQVLGKNALWMLLCYAWNLKSRMTGGFMLCIRMLVAT